MANPSTYDQGTVVRVRTQDPDTLVNAPFTKLNPDETTSTVDPDVVYLVCKKPDGAYIRATWTKGSGDPSSTIVHEGAADSGLFHVDVVADVGNLHTPYDCRLYSTGNGQASYRIKFFATPDPLV